MKFTITDSEYREGLAPFLDENNIEWERQKDGITITVEHAKQAFLIGFKFGEFYKDNDNY